MEDLNCKKWVVIYTRSRHEKVVEKQLSDMGITNYLPLRKTLRQWSDRKKWVEFPLFPNYVFVYANKFDLLRLPEVVGYIKTIFINGKIAIVPERDIEFIKIAISSVQFIDTCIVEFKTFDRIVVTAGPLIGFVGQFIDYKGKKRLAIRIEAVGSCIIVDISPKHIKKLE